MAYFVSHIKSLWKTVLDMGNFFSLGFGHTDVHKVNVAAYLTRFLVVNITWILFIPLGYKLFNEFAVSTMACFLPCLFKNS